MKTHQFNARSSLTEYKLEAFILVYSENDILNSIDIDVVLDQLAAKSKELHRLLTL